MNQTLIIWEFFQIDLNTFLKRYQQQFSFFKLLVSGQISRFFYFQTSHRSLISHNQFFVKLFFFIIQSILFFIHKLYFQKGLFIDYRLLIKQFYLQICLYNITISLILIIICIFSFIFTFKDENFLISQNYKWNFQNIMFSFFFLFKLLISCEKINYRKIIIILNFYINQSIFPQNTQKTPYRQNQPFRDFFHIFNIIIPSFIFLGYISHFNCIMIRPISVCIYKEIVLNLIRINQLLGSYVYIGFIVLSIGKQKQTSELIFALSSLNHLQSSLQTQIYTCRTPALYLLNCSFQFDLVLVVYFQKRGQYSSLLVKTYQTYSVVLAQNFQQVFQ
ncbi:hypothetical protein IMG5_179430 [Ichthyophthirius multifiliis]|uniref:Transmembrane protein n=1 Tax=Ichthyophthirius multifiliis TaxID=5932 RepID=G0R2M2_ICHMU|nr:hypothetical protein IMG5_179430 [Ichthyophthirius multifiliis]EGR28286.1 hypothetical protein IMG5_179430 [Ichthyophthirius multifiliis]|eukprot:XP_004027631.1 hypothetical protein IMG5_179430 [Ichthyophthirius multifiliis]